MKKLLSAILVLALILSGCGNGDESSGAIQEYSTVYSGEITTLNYLVTASTNEFGAVANLVDCLIEYDKYGLPQPSLATDWSVSEDGLVWTFKLREGVKWYTHDGEEYAEVVAQDFVDSMEYILNPDNSSNTANIVYDVIENAEAYYNGEITDFSQVGVKAVDEYTLEYTLTQPTPYFLSMVTYVCFMPVNGDFLDEVGNKFGVDNKNFLYNGSYILETFEPQTRRVFVANENYWDKENVHIKKLNYIYNKEASTLATELYLRGEITGTSIPASSIDEWMNDPEKKAQIRPGQTSFYTYFYAFNFDPQFDEEYEPDNWKVVVNNLNFRKSLFHALDRTAAMMTAEPYEPERKISNTITPKNFVDIGGIDYTQIGSLKEISDGNSFNGDLAVEFRDKALKELDGKATFPVKVPMPYNASGSEWANRAQVIEQQIEKLLGSDYIDIIPLQYPPTGFLDSTRRSGNYAFMEVNWGPDYADPETYAGPFTPDNNYNFPHLALGYEEANGKNKYENMVDAAKKEVVDLEKRYELFAEAEAFLINEAFVLPYGVGGGGFTASKLDPFTSAYAPFGLSESRFKGMKIMEEPMDTETYKTNYEEWEKEREEALKKSKN